MGLEVSWKIWDGKVTSNQLEAAEIEINRIEREMEILPQALSLKVEKAVNQFLQTQSNLRTNLAGSAKRPGYLSDYGRTTKNGVYQQP